MDSCKPRGEDSTKMDYANMSLAELKKACKGRGIKHYYVMKRHDLIRLLSMPELPESYRIEKLTIHQLRDQAREKNIRGFWSLHRDQLVELLYPPLTPQDQENPSKHEGPYNNNSNQVGGKVL